MPLRRRLWLKICLVYTVQKAFGMFRASVDPAVLPSRAPRFPTIQSILRKHTVMDPFLHKVPTSGQALHAK